MEVYTDLFLYGSGIYEKSNQVSGQISGHHSVKLIGWGSENDFDFWVIVLLSHPSKLVRCPE
jgi:hypothetical protein